MLTIKKEATTIRKIKSAIKRMLLTPVFYYPIRPFASSLVKLAYLSRFVEWRAALLTDRKSAPNSPPIPDHGEREELYDFLIETQHLDEGIDYLEFGVYRGNTLRYWLDRNQHADSRFIGFDTFTGLPEDWEGVSKGAFSADGQPPDVNDDRCTFEVGLFQDTLGKFVRSFSFDRKLVVHLDADLYSSTLFVLTRLAPFLKQDDVLVFDDFAVQHGFTHQFRSFLDFVSAYRMDYEVLGTVNTFGQVAIRVSQSTDGNERASEAAPADEADSHASESEA